MFRRLILGAALALMSLAFWSGRPQAAEYRPRVFAGYPGWDHFMPFVAEAFGIWKAYGIEPVFESGSSLRVSQVLQTGEWDAAYTQIATALTYRARGIPLVIAAATSYGSAVVVARPDLESPKDIRRFGIVRQLDSMHLLAAEHILPAHGVDVKQVRFIQVPPPESGLALQRKDIDAYYVYEPYASEVIEKGQARLLWDWREVFNNGEIYRNCLVLHERFVKEHPEAARTIVWAHLAALDVIRKEPEKATTLLVERSKTDRAQVAKGYTRIGWDKNTVPMSFIELIHRDLLKWKVLREPLDLAKVVDYSLQDGYRPPQP